MGIEKAERGTKSEAKGQEPGFRKSMDIEKEQGMEEMNGQEKRIYYMDSCKGMLIVLMVAGHCLALYREDKICYVLYWLIYSFHMPVFIFVSGYFSKNLDKPLCKLFQELIVPMIPFELLYWVIHFGGGERVSVSYAHICLLVHDSIVFLPGGKSDSSQNSWDVAPFCFCGTVGRV